MEEGVLAQRVWVMLCSRAAAGLVQYAFHPFPRDGLKGIILLFEASVQETDTNKESVNDI